MDRVPNSVPVRMKAMEAGDHPDPDLLAALAEQALPERERAQVLLHLSRCAGCREVLALAIPPAGAQDSPSLDTAKRPWFQLPAVRWAAAAACLVIVGSAVLMQRETLMTRGVQTAMVESDAKAREDYSRAAGSVQAPSASMHEEALATSGPEVKPAAPAAQPAPAHEKAGRRNEMRAGPPAVPKSPADTSGFRFSRDGVLGGKLGTFTAGAAGIIGGPRKPLAGSNAAVPAQPVPVEGVNEEFPAKPALAPKEGLKDLPAQGRNVTSLVGLTPGATTENVQVEAAAPAIQVESATDAIQRKREAPGKAKAPAVQTMPDRMEPANETVEVLQEATSSKEALAKKIDMQRAAYGNSPVSRWTISSDGQLQHSVDSGKTWQPAKVAENAVFRALSANGPDVWVGGAAGLLYHSRDAGGHWTQVKPESGGSTLAADIAAIEFTDIHQGKITAANGEVWTTTDGGQNWRKQP